MKYGYILDFYAPKLMLDIEVDGPAHNVSDDARREMHLACRGIRTIRLTNDYVLSTSASEILIRIAAAVKALEGKGSEAGS